MYKRLNEATKNHFREGFGEYKEIACRLTHMILSLGREIYLLKTIFFDGYEEWRDEWRSLMKLHCPHLDVGWAESCMRAYTSCPTSTLITEHTKASITDVGISKILERIRRQHSGSERMAQVEVSRLIFRASEFGFPIDLCRRDFTEIEFDGGFKEYLKANLPFVPFRWALGFLSFYEAERRFKDNSPLPKSAGFSRISVLILPGVPLPMQVVDTYPFFRLVRIDSGSLLLTRFPSKKPSLRWNILTRAFYGPR